MSPRRYPVVAVALLVAFVATRALAQQPPAKTTEQQARSYVASAFMTGAAPVILSEKVVVSPALRQRLDLPPDADGAAVYKALMGVTTGKQVQVRRAAGDEVAQSEAPAPVSEQPIFTVEAGDTTLLVQYDLGHDNISFVGLPGAVATAAPVVAPLPPQKAPEAPAVPAVPAMAAEPPKPGAPTEVPQPAAAAEPEKAAQVVEPQIPRSVKPAATVAVAQPVAPMEEPRPLLRKSGPCEIKPVMTDQDLVNCGATPR
jgi:hypothetical protein